MCRKHRARVSLGRLCQGPRAAVPPGCVPGARPHSAPSPASLTRPCHAEPRLSHQRPAHAQRGSPRGPGVCGALPPASRPPHSSPEASAPSAPLLPQGAPAGPHRGSWRPSPESEAPVEGEGAERAERLSCVGRALGEGDAGRCRRRGRRPARGGRPHSPLPPCTAASAQAPGPRPDVRGPLGRAGQRRRQETRSSQGRARSRTGFCRHRHATQARPPADRRLRGRSGPGALAADTWSPWERGWDF